MYSHLLDELLLILGHNGQDPFTRSRHVVGAAASGKVGEAFLLGPVPCARRVDVAEFVDLGAADEGNVNLAALQCGHGGQHAEGRVGIGEKSRIVHGDGKALRRGGPDGAALGEHDHVRGVGGKGIGGHNDRQPNAHEDNLSVCNFFGTTHHHKFCQFIIGHD